MATEVAALPDDAVAGVFRALPLRSLAVVRCVFKAWRDIVDARALLLPHVLPHSVRGIFINYIGHDRPRLFARPCSPSTVPRVDGKLSFLPVHKSWRNTFWSVLDHCSGLLLCDPDVELGSELCVCNPATRRWTVLPDRHAEGKRYGDYAGAYIAFDPAASPHYQVVLVPKLPEAPSREVRENAEKERRALLWLKKDRDAPFCLDWFFSDDDGGDTSFGKDVEETEAYRDDEFRQLPSVEEEDLEHQIDPLQLPSVEEEDLERQLDPFRLTDWPPTPWVLRVFSSRTGQWEERAFVREGMPAGTVEKMRLNWEEMRLNGASRFARWPYAVYHHESLYVHCQGSFVTRLSLSTSNYRVIEMPTNFRCTHPYLGKLQNKVCFGIVHDSQLKIWILNDSCGRIEWLLKYEAEVGHYAQYVASIPYDHSGTQPNGSWIVEKSTDIHDIDGDVESLSEESYEWDSDNDDTFTLHIGSQEDSYYGRYLQIMGFHPYKEVVFMVTSFRVVAYHLDSSKIQYLGNLRPQCYDVGLSNGIYQSFVYTPCMLGALLHGDKTGQSSFQD